MAAGIYNFTIEQGTTFQRVFKYKDSDGNFIDLEEIADTALRMQIRPSIDSTTKISDFSISSGDGFSKQLTNTVGSDNVYGQFTLTITAATTAAYTFDTAVYDIELDIDGNTTRLLQGKIKLSKEVTR